MSTQTPFAPFGFDPMQAAFATGQELYKAGLLSSVNVRRMARGVGPIGWPQVWPTAREVAWREGPAVLYRYRSDEPRSGASASKSAVLLVCSLINRPYVLDLIAGRSVVERLLGEGLDVWLLDWGHPAPTDGMNGLDHYVLRVLPRATDEVRRATGGAPPHLLGYCMGGTLALCAIAVEAIEAAGLVALATPVDFHDGGTLSTWCRGDGFDPWALASAHGNVPPYVLQPAFKMLDPIGLATKLVHLEDKLEDDAFLRFFLAMETWLEDSVAFPGRAFAEWVEAYRGNALVQRSLFLDGKRVDLSRVRCPLLTVIADGDYICPPVSSLALRALAGSSEHELIHVPGGHIGLSTGRAAHEKVWPRVATWVQSHKKAARRVVRAHQNRPNRSEARR